jgi:predicted dehydrogenase
VRLAVVGAGIYARDAHLPAYAQLQDRFDLVAVCSRTATSAETLAEHWCTLAPSSSRPLIYTDLTALLASPDIDAVDIILPIPVQTPAVQAALAAGKHVVSEKPIAPSRAEAQALLDVHRRYPEKVWMVAENWRYEEAFVRAAELLARGAVGRPLVTYWTQFTPMNRASKYYGTAWRREGEYPGGLLLDGGVHYVSVLRMLLGEITGVAAMARQIAPDLKPLDTITATLEFANGVQGIYLNTFAVGTPFAAALTIVGDEGSLRIERGKLQVARGAAGAGVVAGGGTGPVAAAPVEEIRCAYYNGVERELEAFAAAVLDAVPHRNTPLEALADLAVVEAMLASAADGGRRAPL